MLAREGYALVRRGQAGAQRRKDHRARALPLLHLEAELAVGQGHAVAGGQLGQDARLVQTEAGQAGDARRAGQGQDDPLAAADLDGPKAFVAGANFRAGKVLEDGQGPAESLLQATDVIDHGCEIRGRAVGEVQAKDRGPGFGQAHQLLGAARSGSQGGDDLCAHKSPVAVWRK